WGRWSVLCSPQKFETFTTSDDNVLTWLERLLSRPAAGVSPEQQSPELPYTGGWIGYFSYELGQLLEPSAASQASPSRIDGDWPLIALGYCPAALLFDHTQG